MPRPGCVAAGKEPDNQATEAPSSLAVVHHEQNADGPRYDGHHLQAWAQDEFGGHRQAEHASDMRQRGTARPYDGQGVGQRQRSGSGMPALRRGPQGDTCQGNSASVSSAKDVLHS